MYDLGWDVPLLKNIEEENWRNWLGSLIVASDKFPSCIGESIERLRKLNEITQNAGWRGAGIWIFAGPSINVIKNKELNWKELEDYFRKRLQWSKNANVKYWKVDYGPYGGELKFRAMLTRLAGVEAPTLWLENSRGGGPLNDEECPWDHKDFTGTGSFRAWGHGKALHKSAEIIQFSSVFRTYDVSPHLSIPTTLDRVAQLLIEFSGQSEKQCLINCEDEVIIGAVLGCAMGILRHPLWKELDNYNYDPFNVNHRIDEVVRAVRWHRIAPAFGVGETENYADTLMLEDTWHFKEGDSWMTWLWGKEVKQVAPARVSRNMPLPEVICDGPKPYVISSKNPKGATAVATLPRVSIEKGIYYPEADVMIQIQDRKSPIGIFGSYKSLTLSFIDAVPSSIKILAQDLLSNEAVEITSKTKINGNEILLSGSLIKEIGLSAASKGDISAPGMILILKK